MRILLFPFSLLYGIIIRVRNWLYNVGIKPVMDPPVPVISIGNVSTGGTGKTPLAACLLKWLLEWGQSPAYLSRGYGRKSRGYLQVEAGNMSAHETGDEALQIANSFPQLPVAVSEDRRIGIRQLIETAHPSVCLLDDAFQHRKAGRDLDLIVIDANRLPTRDFLLPAGNLREPRSSLKRGDFIIVNKVRDPDDIPALESELGRFGVPMAFCRPVPTAIRDFEGRRIELSKASQAIVFSGIGNHAAFVHTVHEAGIRIKADYAFRDHHIFTNEDINRIVTPHFHHPGDSANFDGLFLLTTEKDYFRMKDSQELEGFKDLPFAYVPIELKWLKGETELKERLIRLFKT